MALRWGILSTANITDKLLDSGTDQEFVAVASRDAARAEAYAREKGIARAHGSYDARTIDVGKRPHGAVSIKPSARRLRCNFGRLHAGTLRANSRK